MHHESYKTWPVLFEPKSSPKEHQFWAAQTTSNNESSLLRNDPKPDLLSNPNSSPNSASSSEAIEDDPDALDSFKVFNEENKKILCDALQEKVPWQKEIIPEITSTILRCRSRSKLTLRDNKEETWLFFLGENDQEKEKIAREIAKLVFGSQSNFISIGLCNYLEKSSTKKRARDDELSSSYVERLGLALNENPRRVFFIEDIEHVDHFSLKGIMNAIESGKITLPGGEIVPVMDSIIIFSCDRLTSSSCEEKINVDQNNNEKDNSDDGSNPEKRTSGGVSLDLNIAVVGDENEEDHSVVKILMSVDAQIVFKKQESCH